MPRTRLRLLALGGISALTAGLLASACSVPGFGPKADDAAHELASALSAGTLTGVPFVGSDSASATAYTATVRGMGEKPTVAAGKTSTDGDRATASLSWSWKVGAKTWRYDTSVSLAKGRTSDGTGWLVRWSPSLVNGSLKTGEVLRTTGLTARRGDVLGAADVPLVTPRPVLRIGLDKARVVGSDVTTPATRLATLLHIDVAAYVKQVRTTGPKAFVQGIVYRRDQVPAGLLGRLASINGAGAVSDRLPLAPSKEFAAAVLGTVGPATAEVVKDSKGRIEAGDDVGLSGLEKRYDEQLGGTRGAEVVAVGDQGTGRRVLFTADPVAGKPLRTTLDPHLQALAEKALGGVGPASALVAIRPSTGDLVAVASGAGSKGYDTATIGRYAPGSTFKIVSALALLRAGETPSTTVPCTPTLVVDGKQFKNYSDYPASGLGRISLEDALANSCNTAFISQRDRLEGGDLAGAAAALGLGVDHDTGFPAYFGEVGPPASETQAAASMIGQGTVLASPMAMATVVASVLHGSAVLPRLLPEVEVQQKKPATPLTAAEARSLRTMMRAVVERGSGALLAGLPGGPVIAKTGTAEFGDKPPLPTHAWMVAGHDDLAVAVFVDRGESGSGTAGPILEQFLRVAR